MSQQTYSFNVEPITCEGCSKAIKNALGKYKDISEIEVDVPTKTVKLTTLVTKEDIIERLKKAGRTAKAL